MSKYTNTTITGFNATPPSDDGTEVDSNKVKWQTHLDKLASPVKNLAEAINTALISHFDIGPVAHAVNYTVVVADYGKTLESSGTITITMGTLAALGAGFIVSIKNVGAGIITVDGASAETIDGNLTIALDPNESVLLQSDAGMSDWLILSRIDPVTRASLLLDTTDDVTFGGVSTGSLGITHIATVSDEHAIEIACDAAGFGDVRAIEIEYITGAISSLAEESTININVNRVSSGSGSRVMGLNVNATADGSAIVQAVRAGAQVDPINHSSGSFGNPTFASNNTTATDVAIMRDGSDGTTTSIMVADNDYIIVGAAAAFGSLTLNLTTFSNQSIIPTFFFSEAGTDTFGQFFPTDGTDGLKQSGVISWDPASLTNHAADTVTGTFNIKIVRTRNGLSTTPILGHAETALIIPYGWDKDGDLTINDLATNIVTATTVNTTTLTATNAVITNLSSQAIIFNPVLTGGTATAYTAAIGITAYVTGTVYRVRIHVLNTGSATISFDGLTATIIRLLDASALVIGDMLLNSVIELRYTGAYFVLLNPQLYTTTFLPELWDSSLSGSESQTYAVQQGRYWKQNGLVNIDFKMQVTSLGSLTTGDFVQVGNLPFDRSFGGTLDSAVNISLVSAMSLTAGYNVTGKVSDGAGFVELFVADISTGVSAMLVSEFTASGVIEGSCRYPI